jgi:hypothetical protein
VRAAKRGWGRPSIFVLVALGLGVASLPLSLLLGVIWPGEAKLTAPWLCPEDQTDAFVVVDVYRPTPGESNYNFSLHCMGERGDASDEGWLVPQALLWLAHWALLVALLVVLAVVGWARRRRARQGDGVLGAPPVVSSG